MLVKQLRLHMKKRFIGRKFNLNNNSNQSFESYNFYLNLTMKLVQTWLFAS